MERGAHQTTRHILMVRPARFGYNPETAANNAFQVYDDSMTPDEIAAAAREEFDAFVAVLREAGVQVWVVEDTPEPPKPDAVFPNNWVTFHNDGTVITYPMFAPQRRLERREDIIKYLGAHFQITRRVKLERYEAKNRFLEGTGSMVLDRQHRIVYACSSPRTDEFLLDEFCRLMGYEKEFFRATDARGQEIYHTNVMMAMGETFVVICLESVADDYAANRLIERFYATNKEIVEISYRQMMSFAGNMLQVQNDRGERLLVMSDQAYLSLTQTQIRQLEKHCRLVHSPIDTIETYGGGSARCMMAEIFLPEKEED